MMWLNKTVKGIGYLAIHLLTAFKCYLLSLIFTAPFIVTVFAIMSGVLGRLPQAVNEKFIIVYLCSCLPLFIIFFIIVETKYFSTYIKDR